MALSRLRPTAILCCCLLLPGCTLIDQRTFDRHAGRAPVPHAPAQVAAGASPVPPLFVVHAGTPDQDWQPGLREAVGEALARKPNALFTVEGVAPLAVSPEAQAVALGAAATANGRPVAAAIVADGAQPGQVEMTARSDATVAAPEVRVFVR